MPAAIQGRKIGMTRFFMEDGTSVPVTVIQAGPCAVTQVKTPETDGYSAVQIAFEDIKPRRSTMAVIGHDAKAGVSPKRVHRELRLADEKQAGEFEAGKEISVSVFDGIKYVDIVGVSKGKGFQGVMVRHHFKGMFASHGNERMHRHGGSIGSHATNRGWGPKPKKGKKMGGHMGDARVTVRNLDVISIDPEKNLLLVKGAVPGPNQGMLFVREAVRLNRSKARKVAEAGK
jgi:large subunit ribosomal protein L3